MMRVEDISVDNVNDVFKICSYNKLEDQLQKQGIELKRRWLHEMLEEYGSCTKIAYLDGKPVAQILYYPETAVPFIVNPRNDVIELNCVYNPFSRTRKKGVGTTLIKSLLDDCREGLSSLKGRPCRFVVAKPFTTGEGIPLSKFYSANGFKQGQEEMFKEVRAIYQPRELEEYQSLPEDRGRAVVFFNPICEWSYPFAVRIGEFLREIDPNLNVELINAWLRPEESIKRGNKELIVNGKLISSFWTEREAFRREVEQALKS